MQAALRRHLPHHPLRMRSGNLFKIMQPSTTTLPHSHPPSPLFHHCHQLDHSIIEKDRNTNIKDNLLFPGEEAAAAVDGNDHGDLRDMMMPTATIMRAAMKRTRSIENARTRTAGFEVKQSAS